MMMLACLALLPACITGQYNRVDRGQQPEAHLLHGFKVGESSMQACIDQLGAPLVVREHGDGADLIWGWERNSGMNVTASIPLGDAGSGNVSYSHRSGGAQGWTLEFDSNWILSGVHEGRLQELLGMGSQPPRLVE